MATNRSLKVVAILLLATCLYAVVMTKMYLDNVGKADYYVCTFNTGSIMQGNLTYPNHWQCTNATGYYARVAVCNYEGTGVIP